MLQQQIKQKTWHTAEKWIWLFLPIGLLMGVLLGRHLIFDFVQLYFPPCVFYTVTHFYCPGCGNTRTVLALLHGHPLQALHNNAAFCYLLVLLYLQKVLRCFGKPVQLLPKGNWFPVVSCMCLHGILPDSEFYPLDATAACINEDESERKRERCFIHH